MGLAVSAPLPIRLVTEWDASAGIKLGKLGLLELTVQKLSEAGLSPSPQAERATLIRRATYDLIGLPPTPQEIQDFLKDTRPGAFARVVDRLLALGKRKKFLSLDELLST